MESEGTGRIAFEHAGRLVAQYVFVAPLAARLERDETPAGAAVKERIDRALGSLESDLNVPLRAAAESAAVELALTLPNDAATVGDWLKQMIVRICNSHTPEIRRRHDEWAANAFTSGVCHEIETLSRAIERRLGSEIGTPVSAALWEAREAVGSPQMARLKFYRGDQPIAQNCDRQRPLGIDGVAKSHAIQPADGDTGTLTTIHDLQKILSDQFIPAWVNTLEALGRSLAGQSEDIQCIIAQNKAQSQHIIELNEKAKKLVVRPVEVY